MNRREFFLGTGTVVLSAGIAGCASEPEAESAENGEDPGSQEEEQEVDEDQEDGPEAFDFGESVEFSAGEEAITVRPHDARLTNAIIFNRDERIRSDTPDDDLFLLYDIDLENIGEEEVRVPRQFDLTIDGSGYDTEFMTNQVENPYSELDSLRPGTSETRTIVYSIPDSSSVATIFAEFGFLDTVTAEWELDLTDADREIVDYTDNEVGESIQVGTEERQYELAVTNVELADTYSYEGYSGEREEEASSGQQWALVTIRAENIGEGRVSVPSTYDARVIADQQQFDTELYRRDDEYDGGDLSEGIVDEGIMKFEVPDGADDMTLEIELTRDIVATWSIN